MNKVILLADNSQDHVAIFKRVLNSAGVDNPLLVVNDGNQAIKYLNGEGIYGNRELFPKPTLLFLDLLMPYADGWEVLKWLRDNPDKGKLLVVVLTCSSQQKRLQEAYRMGANSFLVKPFNKAELEELVRYWPEAWMLSPATPHNLHEPVITHQMMGTPEPACMEMQAT